LTFATPTTSASTLRLTGLLALRLTVATGASVLKSWRVVFVTDERC
jgi:hypothetical protein